LPQLAGGIAIHIIGTALLEMQLAAGDQRGGEFVLGFRHLQIQHQAAADEGGR
jgi:hypothetical protein